MKIVTIFWILLAVLCGGYGILIRAIGSGTGFFLVWIALAVIFVGCSQQHRPACGESCHSFCGE